MGLDITALRQMTRLDEPDDDYAWHVFCYREFPGRCTLPEGYYVGLDAFNFRAGSYSGYNEWREMLAKFAGYPSAARGDRFDKPHSCGAWVATSGPFWELINFADNEGTIAGPAAQKLAADFADYQARVDALPNDSDSEWFKARYRDWRKAFDIACDAGAVIFH